MTWVLVVALVSAHSGCARACTRACTPRTETAWDLQPSREPGQTGPQGPCRARS